jgi:hypothetical protein
MPSLVAHINPTKVRAGGTIPPRLLLLSVDTKRYSGPISAIFLAFGVIARRIQVFVSSAYNGNNCTVLLDPRNTVSPHHKISVSETAKSDSNYVSPEPYIFCAANVERGLKNSIDSRF